MDKSSREMELTSFFDQYLKDNPQIIEALEIFKIGQDQYVNALAQMNSTVIVTSTTTNQGEVNYAKLDCNKI